MDSSENIFSGDAVPLNWKVIGEHHSMYNYLKFLKNLYQHLHIFVSLYGTVQYLKLVSFFRYASFFGLPS